MEKKLYFALDVNDKFINLLAVDNDSDSSPRVVAWTKVETKGYHTFDVTNQEVFTNQLKILVDKFEKEYFIKVGKVAVCIDTNFPTFAIRTKTLKFEDDKKITKNDISNALDDLKELLTTNIKTAFCALPLSYRVNLKNVDSPIGVIGSDLEVKALVTSTNSKELYKYLVSIENAGIEILDIAPTFISNIFESFEIEDNRKRTVLLDFGYRNSRIVFYDSGILTNYHHLDFGLDDIKEELKSNMKIGDTSIDSLFELVYKNKEVDLDQVITLLIDNEPKEINIIDVKIELNKILTQTITYLKSEILSIVSDYSVMIITNILSDVENIITMSQSILKRDTKVIINDESIFEDSTWTNALGMINYTNYSESIYELDINKITINRIEYNKHNIEFVDVNATQEVEIRDKDNNEQYQEIILEEKQNKTKVWFKRIKEKLFDNKTGDDYDE